VVFVLGTEVSVGPTWARIGRALVALWLSLSVVACGRPERPPPPPPSVLTLEVGVEDVPIYGEWVGTTQGFVNAQIRPNIEGYLLEQVYSNGAAVSADEPLFRIDPRQFQAAFEDAKGEVTRAEALLERSRLNVERYRPLAARGAVSQKELDDAIQGERAQRAALESARAQLGQASLNLGWTEVRSPISGVASIARAQVGDLVNPQTLLARVSTIDPIRVSFPISEQQYLIWRRSQVRGDASGLGTARLTLADGEVYPEAGKFYALGLDVDPSTGTIMVEATFPNPESILRPGQFARIRVQIDERKGAVTVPQRAVRDLQGQNQVAVVGKDDIIEMRNVTLGPTFGTLWVVDQGLEKGETIVVEGLQRIRGGVKVDARPAPSATRSSPGT
jgi:membrane fusion protein (multidrug efflux system)